MNSRFLTQKANHMTAGIAAKSASIPNGIVIGADNAKAVASMDNVPAAIPSIAEFGAALPAFATAVIPVMVAPNAASKETTNSP